MKRILLVALGASFAFGCAPERPELGESEYTQGQMAVLTTDDGGGWDVAILSASGEITRTVDVGVNDPSGLAYHPDGFFLVHDWSNMYRVELDGETERFNSQPLNSGIFRINVTDDGDVTVAAEYDVTKLDSDGDVVADTQVPSTYCWMDAAEPADSNSDAALLDIFGPSVAAWNAEDDSFEVIANGVGYDANVLGHDDGGSYWVGSTYGSQVQHVSAEGDVTPISLSGNLYGVLALEPASRDSVYALSDGNDGSAILEIDADGEITEIATAETALWRDLIVF